MNCCRKKKENLYWIAQLIKKIEILKTKINDNSSNIIETKEEVKQLIDNIQDLASDLSYFLKHGEFPDAKTT